MNCRCADRDREACAFVAGADTCSCACHAPPATVAPRAAQTFRVVQVRTCAAKHCDAIVNLDRLMCPSCWRLVPAELQKDVWRTYRPGQEITGRITPSYARAALEAIDAVEKAKRKVAERAASKAAQGKLFE